MATQHASTQQIANRLVELGRQGKIEEIQKELFSDDIVSIEPMGDNPIAKGMAAIIEKGKQFEASLEAVHGSELTEPIVVGNWFSIGWTFDATMKGRGRMKMEEICVYHVKDGKIISEQFFFSM